MNNEFKRMQKLAGLLTENKEVDDLIKKDLETKNINSTAIKTNWNDLDWDFSDSDSVSFGDFEVDMDQFKTGSKKGYVVDNDGVKRDIDKATIKFILQSYKENW